jgi:hypothetical protein
MPSKGPGARYSTFATKQVTHGNPCVEHNHAGIAHLVDQQAPIWDPSNAAAVTAAALIKVGDDIVIDMEGIHHFASSLLPGGVAIGDPLWIAAADNTLQTAAGAGRTKFGILSELDTVLGRAGVNLTQRSSF